MTMKGQYVNVKELIEELKKYPEGAIVYHAIPDTLFDELGDDEIRGILSSEIDKMEKWIKDNPDYTPIGPSYEPVATGWICPKCGRSLSPLTKVCPCSERWEVTC